MKTKICFILIFAVIMTACGGAPQQSVAVPTLTLPPISESSPIATSCEKYAQITPLPNSLVESNVANAEGYRATIQGGQCPTVWQSDSMGRPFSLFNAGDIRIVVRMGNQAIPSVNYSISPWTGVNISEGSSLPFVIEPLSIDGQSTIYVIFSDVKNAESAVCAFTKNKNFCDDLATSAK